MTIWLVEPSKLSELHKAHEAGLYPTAKEQLEYEQQCAAEARDGSPRSLVIAGNVAQIHVHGLLTEKPSLFARIFGDGNTTYEDLRAALAEAQANPAVSRIEFAISSPGGTHEGLLETLSAIESTAKPMKVRASHATSAAYAIAAVAGPITAETDGSIFGSIGVAISYLHLEEVIDITNTASPKKRPDLTTDEGKKVVQEFLDQLFEPFAEAIARGRGTTLKVVSEEFGQGGMFATKEAKRLGMIDSRAPQPRQTARAAAGNDIIIVQDAAVTLRSLTSGEPVSTKSSAPPRGQTSADEAEPIADRPSPTAEATARKEATIMDLAELKAKHPETYNAAVRDGREQAEAQAKTASEQASKDAQADKDKSVEEAVAAERKRVSAHLKMGKSFGAMDVAMKAIQSGASTFDEEIHAEYMTAGRNKKDSETRQEESDDAGRVVDGRAQEEPEADDKDALADAIDRVMNGEL